MLLKFLDCKKDDAPQPYVHKDCVHNRQYRCPMSSKNKIIPTDVNINASVYRDTFRTLLGEIIGGDSSQLIQDIEVGVFNWSLEYAISRGIARNWKCPMFCKLYQNKARSLLANLDPNAYVGNSRLLQRVKDGEFQPRDLASMPPEHMCPERWKELLDTKLQRNEQIYEEKPEAMTDKFKCGRCKKRECTYREVQLRSADEPMTLLICCINCGHRWKI